MAKILGEIVLPTQKQQWAFNDSGQFQPVCVPVLDHITSVTTESTSAEDLYVGYIQPNTFLNDGDEIYVSYYGIVETSGNPKQLNVFFSGNTVYSDTITDFSYETFRVDLALWRENYNTLSSECILYFDSGVRVNRTSVKGVDFTVLNPLVFSATTFISAGELTLARVKGVFRPRREIDTTPPDAPEILGLTVDSDTEITVTWQ